MLMNRKMNRILREHLCYKEMLLVLKMKKIHKNKEILKLILKYYFVKQKINKNFKNQL
jgi:hypothetical protein